MKNKMIYIWFLSAIFLMADPMPPIGFEFNQSQRQAFYIFYEATINNDPIAIGDWIGAFNVIDETQNGSCDSISDNCPDSNGDGFISEDAHICVGSFEYNDNLVVIPVPVMGADSLITENGDLCEQTGTCDYLQSGDYPIFKLYDSSIDQVLYSTPSQEYPFSNLGVFIIDSLYHDSYQEYSIVLEEGNNFVSFWNLPFDNSIENVFASSSYVYYVIGQGYASQNLGNDDWIGSLEFIDRTKGYWLRVSSDDTLNIAGLPSQENLLYHLYNVYPESNFISYPFPVQNMIESTLPDDVENNFFGIIGQGMATQRIGSNWEGTLTHLEGTKGYVALILNPISFSFNSVSSEERYVENNYNFVEAPPSQFDFNLSSQQSFYFIHDVDVNQDILSDNLWIITYCNTNVVGARKWNRYITDLPAMGNDGTELTEGYCNNNDIPEFKVYDKDNNYLIDLYSSEIPSWRNNQIFNINLQSVVNNTELPNQFTLLEPYPNPFNAVTTLDYIIYESSYISIEVIDIYGSIYETLKSKAYHTTGNYSIKWETNTTPSGIYFIRMTNLNNKENIIQKVMLIK